jgi:predicted RNase H-like HicB family nuclease
MKLTAIIEHTDDGWFVGQLEQMPEVISQGKTQAELMENLGDALEQVLIARRELAEQAFTGREVTRAELLIVG